jgi:signal transduction histidine kinase
MQDLRWVIEMIDAQLGKLSRIVTDVVASTEKNSSAFVLDRTDTDIVALVGQVAARARLHDGTHEIVVLAPGPLRARVDAARLQQVVTSLLDNAMKFSPNGRRIEIVVAAQAAATFQMEVRDHGPGVPLEQRARLFERFFRAHVDKYQSGLGLGLSTSREIVTRHGGTIVANFPPEGGMHVIVTLPIDPPATVVEVSPPTA